MKKFFFLLTGLIIGAATWIFWSKSPTLPIETYFTIKDYGVQFRKPSDTLVVMTYNIGYLSGMTNNLPMDRPEKLIRQNLLAARQVLAATNPDLIGFQEIDFAADRSYQTNQLDSLSSFLKFPTAYQSVNWDKRYVPFPYWPPSQHFGKVVSGQAIASRYPLLNPQTVVLARPLSAPEYYQWYYLERLIQIVDVQVGATNCKLMNVHLEAFDEATREVQAHEVKRIYEEFASKGPVFLIGDFNSKPVNETDSNAAMNVIMQGAHIRSAITPDAYQADPEGYFTFSSGQPYQMIDYLLFNANFISCVEARVVREAGEISDHLPVIGKFVLTEGIE